MRNLLEYSGSLISNDSLIVAPYDYQKLSYENILPLNNGLIKNWNIQKFSSDYSEIEHLNVINGMGVTLGDSIVGISVLSAIKKKNPKIKIKLIRPETAPSYVEELYELASSVIDELHYMPFHIQKLPYTALNIDVGNQLYSPDFHIMEMHDYFIQGLGVKLDDVNHNELSNKWLGNIDLGAPVFENYTLFAPIASTKIRSIPSKFYYDIVDMLSRREGDNKLNVIDLHKRYGEHEVLKGVSLQAKAGDVISIIGSSGSGKSTFLRCINFLEKPSEGTIVVSGQNIGLVRDKDGQLKVADKNQLRLLRTRLTMVFQHFNLWSHMTVLENVMEAPIQVLGLNKQEARERAVKYLAKVGIDERQQAKYPVHLSGGQQQRVSIARALAI